MWLTGNDLPVLNSPLVPAHTNGCMYLQWPVLYCVSTQLRVMLWRVCPWCSYTLIHTYTHIYSSSFTVMCCIQVMVMMTSISLTTHQPKTLVKNTTIVLSCMQDPVHVTSYTLNTILFIRYKNYIYLLCIDINAETSCPTRCEYLVRRRYRGRHDSWQLHVNYLHRLHL